MKVDDLGAHRYCNIAHIEQRGEREEELTEGGPLPLASELEDLVGDGGQCGGRGMGGCRSSGESTNERAARHGTTQSLSF